VLTIDAEQAAVRAAAAGRTLVARVGRG
jgi:hypothetical protein